MKVLRLALLILIFLSAHLLRAQYPEGFVEEVAYDEFDVAAGILFADSSLSVVWELNGKVWIIVDGEVADGPIIDISEEVAFYGDLGMIGATLHPDFSENGFIYLYYSVDTHYLQYYGTPEYNPLANETKVSMGRITRYTIDPESLTLVPDSRKIILGDEIGSGIPICAPSHGVGQLMFGKDGSLLATSGDGNTWVGSSPSTGWNGEGPLPDYAHDDIALDIGILDEKEFLGAFRSQYMNGLNGKILRMDPSTGRGLPNNPYYDESDPDSPRSKIWALGFRNPYRYTILPNTGGGDLQNGDPGTIVVSDVGDWVWEEINFVTEGGGNYGWPMYQGPMVYGYYHNVSTTNTTAPNPINSPGCPEFLDYQDVIVQENLQHDYFFPNPCNITQTIENDAQTFVHRRPALSFANSANENNEIVPLIAAMSTFDENGVANYTSVEDAGIAGGNFTGISGTGGVFLEGDRIPEEYRGWYTLADFSGWLRAIKFDESNEPVAIEKWNENIGPAIHITQSPFDQCIYVTTIAPSQIKKICFGGNLKPVIQVTPDTVFGVGELDVVLDASESYDPEGEALSFEWEFEDGTLLQGETIQRLFIPESGGIERENILLRVTDESGASAEQIIPVSLNNTPPAVDLTSIEEGQLYSTTGPTVFSLLATVEDAESSPSQMDYQWTHILHHNTHFHYLDFFSGNNRELVIYPTGCNPFETYWYEIRIQVTDPGGLTATDNRMIYPDCDGTLEEPEGEGDVTVSPNPTDDLLTITADGPFAGSVEYKIYSVAGNLIRSDIEIVYNNRRFFRINVEGLSTGIYVLEIRSGNRLFKEKFVKY